MSHTQTIKLVVIGDGAVGKVKQLLKSFLTQSSDLSSYQLR